MLSRKQVQGNSTWMERAEVYLADCDRRNEGKRSWESKSKSVVGIGANSRFYCLKYEKSTKGSKEHGIMVHQCWE